MRSEKFDKWDIVSTRESSLAAQSLQRDSALPSWANAKWSSDIRCLEYGLAEVERGKPKGSWEEAISATIGGNTPNKS